MSSTTIYGDRDGGLPPRFILPGPAPRVRRTADLARRSRISRDPVVGDLGKACLGSDHRHGQG